KEHAVDAGANQWVGALAVTFIVEHQTRLREAVPWAEAASKPIHPPVVLVLRHEVCVALPTDFGGSLGVEPLGIDDAAVGPGLPATGIARDGVLMPEHMRSSRAIAGFTGDTQLDDLCLEAIRV